MSNNDSCMALAASDYRDENVTIPLHRLYTTIWLDFGTGGLFNTSSFIYAYLWKNVDVSENRFTNCALCYNRILSLRDQGQKLFIIITDPIKPVVQRDLFLLWSRLLFESQVARIYIIQTKFDFTFYRYWLSFKQHQKIYFIPTETLLLQQLRENRNTNTVVICLETGTSEIVDINEYQFNELFFDAVQCFNHILSIRQQEIILVINSQNSGVFNYRVAIEKLFSTQYYIYMLSTLTAIYILTSARTKQIGTKQTDVFSNFGLFRKELEQDISPNSPYLCNDEVIYSSSTEILQMSLRTVLTERFLYFTNIVADMPQTSDAKTEMIEECRQYYKNNSCQLEKINEFVYKYYEQKINTAIWWYTQDSFLYRRLNEACRTEDIDLIYTYRNFISDLLQQLQEEHEKFCYDLCGVPIKVFRGQQISINELKYLRKNIGQLFSTNSFLSATGDYNVALLFAGCNQLSGFESVVFEYNIDTSIKTKRPYADIRFLSSKPSEQEIMFCMGTVFRTESIEQKEMNEDNNNKYMYWYVVMKLVSENDDSDLVLKLKELNKRYQIQPVLLTIAELAKTHSHISNDFCKAERYLRLYLDELLTVSGDIDYKNLIRVYGCLAKLCEDKGDYAASIEYSEHIIKICVTYPSSLLNIEECERIDAIVSAYNAKAYIYRYKTIDYDNVIETYNELLEYLQGQGNPCLRCATLIINVMGDIFKKQGRWSTAIDFYERARLLNSGNSKYLSYLINDAKEELHKMQNRYPEVLFFLLLIIWCYSYPFDVFNADKIISQNLMSLAFINLINYYSVQYVMGKVSNAHQRRLIRLDALINKIQKKFTNLRLHKQKQRIFDRIHIVIPSFTSLPMQPWPLLTNRNTLQRWASLLILGTILLAAYLPVIFLLLTRIVMIWFIVTWLSDFNIIHWLSFIIPFYYCWKQAPSLLFTYIFLLQLDFQLVARQKRNILDAIPIHTIEYHRAH